MVFAISNGGELNEGGILNPLLVRKEIQMQMVNGYRKEIQESEPGPIAEEILVQRHQRMRSCTIVCAESLPSTFITRFVVSNQ